MVRLHCRRQHFFGRLAWRRKGHGVPPPCLWKASDVCCFVLRGPCTLVVGDTPCIGLGHGLTGDVWWDTSASALGSCFADLAHQRGFEHGFWFHDGPRVL